MNILYFYSKKLSAWLKRKVTKVVAYCIEPNMKEAAIVKNLVHKVSINMASKDVIKILQKYTKLYLPDP